MRNELPKFFEQILNVNDPWEIEKITQQLNEIHIYIDFKKELNLNMVANTILHTILFKEHGDT